MCNFITSNQINSFFDNIKSKHNIITFEALEAEFNKTFKTELKTNHGVIFLLKNMTGYIYKEGVFTRES